jgi:hypothetical protein
VAFGGDDWEEVYLSQEKQLEHHRRFLDAYRHSSERWHKIIEGQSGALTDTSTEKSKSPATASDKDLPRNMDDKKGEKASWHVDLEGIEGLELDGLSPFEHVDVAGDGDVVMGDDDFDMVDKSEVSSAMFHARKLGLDLDHPENWSDEDKELYDFLFKD